MKVFFLPLWVCKGKMNIEVFFVIMKNKRVLFLFLPPKSLGRNELLEHLGETAHTG